MGFSINYRSTRPVSDAEADTIRQAARSAIEGRTWLSCEPPIWFHSDDDGYLVGSSKPNPLPHPDDAASAALEGLPDGTTRDLVNVLSQISRDHGVDWEISHDASDGSVGYIRDGACAGQVLKQVELFAELGDILAELGEDGLA